MSSATPNSGSNPKINLTNNGNSGITEAVIGAGNSVKTAVIVTFVLVLIAGAFLVYNRRKNKKSNLH